MISFLVNLISVIFLGIAQISFLATWPLPISNLNLILSLIIFLAVIIDYHKGLWWALGGGLFLELYSGSVFGLTTLSLLLTVIGINFLFNNFFTNRSFYSLMILGFIATFIYNLSWLGFHFILALVGVNLSLVGINFVSQFVWQPILNLLILAIIFTAYYFSTGRLRNIFLFPNQPSQPYETKWKG